MLDIKLLRTEPQRVQDNLRERGVSLFEGLDASASVARLQDLDQRYLDLLKAQEELRHAQKENSVGMKSVGKLPKEDQKAARDQLIEEGRALREREKELGIETAAAQQARDEVWAKVPNMTHPEVPRGGTDDDHRVLRTHGTPRDFAAEGFEPKDHLALCEQHDLVDFQSGGKVVGQKFYYLKNQLVLLDLALQRYALNVAMRHGFTIHTTPDLAREEILAGLGFNPRGESTQVYSVANSDLCLVGTAEVTLGGMLADTIVEQDKLPILLAGLSHCFRTEAGSAGQESRGLYRVHQFTKVEMFAFTEGTLEASEAMHARMLAIEEELFAGLELPYRVLDIATGDLGGPAYRKYDIEAWMPGRGDYGEVTSTSNCTDYQARRLKIRYRAEGEAGGKGKPKAKNKFVHMLNGTAVANTRALLAILENHQQADGSIAIPPALQGLAGFDRIPS